MKINKVLVSGVTLPQADSKALFLSKPASLLHPRRGPLQRKQKSSNSNKQKHLLSTVTKLANINQTSWYFPWPWERVHPGVVVVLQPTCLLSPSSPSFPPGGLVFNFLLWPVNSPYQLANPSRQACNHVRSMLQYAIWTDIFAHIQV